MNLEEHRERLAKANALILFIASVGRKFFRHEDRVAHLILDYRGRVRFVDPRGDFGDSIDTHYRGRWSGFSWGGTMRRLIEALRDYVMKGEFQPDLGPWPAWFSGGDPWAYGPAMELVRAEAERLGFTRKEAR